MQVVSLSEAVQNWKTGRTVWSVELGGMGPGYEQAIQIILWEILARWPGNPVLPEPKETDTEYPIAFTDHVNKVVKELDVGYGFSGAQVGSAKATAYQFLAYGYPAMMAKAPDDRTIQVSRNFPSMDFVEIQQARAALEPFATCLSHVDDLHLTGDWSPKFNGRDLVRAREVFRKLGGK